MRIDSLRNIKHSIYILSATLLLLYGCSSPNTQQDNSNEVANNTDDSTEENSFRSELAVEENPVEAEVVKDLSRLGKHHKRRTINISRAPGSEFGYLKNGVRVSQGRMIKQNLKESEEDEEEDGESGGAVFKNGYMNYVVKNGDTLMKISYKVFADPLRWKEIYKDNKKKIHNPNALVRGTVFKLRASKFAKIQKNGDPYLIKRRDTLAKISNGIYGTPGNWRKLWKNNPQLIRDPNKIYAGFTIYYVMTEKETQESDRLAGKTPPTQKPL